MKPMKKYGAIQLLVVTFYLAMVSCEPDVASLTWDPLDYPQAIEDMANPTGHLTNGSPGETLDMIAAELGVSSDEFQLIVDDYRAIHQELESLLDLLKDSDGGQSLEDMEGTDFDEDVKGTSAYVRILCSESDQDSLSSDPNSPDYQGEIRIDDPNLSAKDAVKNGYTPDGQLLLDFKTCQGEDLTIAGQCPTFASDYYDNLLLEMNVTLYPNDRDSYNLSNYSLFSTDGISILFEISGEGTYTISLGVDEGYSVILGTAEGDYFCTLGGEVAFQCGVTVTPFSQ
jgi:hypothetical protein